MLTMSANSSLSLNSTTHLSTIMSTSGRNPDGTFTKGSEAASEAGHKGGLHSTGGIMNVTSSETGPAATGTEEGRNADGTFTKGSEAAKEAGRKGGSA